MFMFYLHSFPARKAGQGVLSFYLQVELLSLREKQGLVSGSRVSQRHTVRTQLAWTVFISMFDKYLVSCYHGPGIFPGVGEMLIKSRKGLCSHGAYILRDPAKNRGSFRIFTCCCTK